MNKQDFLTYFDHFNNKRYDEVAKYFASDATVEYFSNPQMPEAKPLTIDQYFDSGL